MGSGCWLRGLLVVALSGAILATPAAAKPQSGQQNRPTACVYTRQGISGVRQAAAYLGIPARCAFIFDNSAPDWTTWEHPWFLDRYPANSNFARWARGRGRTLVISLSLIPYSVLGVDWRSLGGKGAYVPYARVLAQNLIQAGLSHAIIRLADEPNGPWFIDNMGTTVTQRVEWLRLWQATAKAMLSQPGAHFRFDWTVNARAGSAALDQYYPGDKLVSFIGIDVYDALPFAVSNAERWQILSSHMNGVIALWRFARAHHKRFSIPEWGLIAQPFGGGDDPAYVRHLAALIHSPGGGYQSYFFASGSRTTLYHSPRSLAVYRRAYDRDP